MALTNAERQARCRERRKAGESRIRYRRPADRRSRPEQWPTRCRCSRRYRTGTGSGGNALPETLAGSATAALLEQVCELDLSVLEPVEFPRGFGRDGQTTGDGLPSVATKRSRMPASGGRGAPGSCASVESAPRHTAACRGHRRPRSGGDGRRVNALARVLRYATALRVTPRPAPRSDGSYGPCGPAWTERPGRPRRYGRGRPPMARARAAQPWTPWTPTPIVNAGQGLTRRSRPRVSPALPLPHHATLRPAWWSGRSYRRKRAARDRPRHSGVRGTRHRLRERSRGTADRFGPRSAHGGTPIACP